jgi:hypothetical protein
VKNILEWFVEEAKTIFGNNLNSIILYGSRAIEPEVGKKSDHNVLILLKDASASKLRAFGKVVRKWTAAGSPVPAVFSVDMFAKSADVFPIEFLDMQLNRKVLFGEDALAGIEVDEKNLRHQCEYELKIKLLAIKKAGMLAKGDRDFRDIIAGSISAVLSVVKHSVRLFGEKTPKNRIEALDVLKSKLGIDPEVFKIALNIKHKDPSVKSVEAEPLFDRYTAELEKIVNAVDNV